jgi:CubicO group peptidase (beta-lactamase class C family)
VDDEVAGWPGAAGVAVVGPSGLLASTGADEPYPWASVTKILSALTILLACADGVLDLDDPAGPPGATLRHLLGHTSGLAFDADRTLAPPGKRRIYSNRGIEVAAEVLEKHTGRPFADLVTQHVLVPLGMTRSRLDGSPARDGSGPVSDLALLAHELLVTRVLETHRSTS